MTYLLSGRVNYVKSQITITIIIIIIIIIIIVNTQIYIESHTQLAGSSVQRDFLFSVPSKDK